MRFTSRLFLCVLILSLVSCAFLKTTNINSARELTACKLQCKSSFNTCSQVCMNNCSTCGACSKQKAKRSYAKYIREQCVQGGNIARELKSYCDPLQCRKTTCDCTADYQICVRSCASIAYK